MSEQTTYPKKEKEKKPSLRLGFTQDRDKTRKQHFIFLRENNQAQMANKLKLTEESTAHHQAQAQTQQKEEETNKKKRNI